MNNTLPIPIAGRPPVIATPAPAVVAKPVGPEPEPQPVMPPQPIGVVRAAKKFGTQRPSGIEQVIVQPGQQFPVQAAGDLFTVISSTGPYKVKVLPAGREVLLYAGMTLRTEPFQQLQVTNPSSTAVLTMLVWVGFDKVSDYQVPQIPVTPVEGLTIIAATGVVQSISLTDVFFRAAFLYGYSAMPAGAAPTPNGQLAFVGRSKAFQPDELAQGLAVPYGPLPPGGILNMANMFISGTAGDGVFWTCTL
jgi:hypothetical protein